MPLERRAQGLELPWRDQCIEAQPQRRQRRQRAGDVGARDPVRIGQVLQHRPHAFEQRVGGESTQRRDRIDRRKVSPADDATNQAVTALRDLEQELRFRDGRCRLHQHRGSDPRDPQRRLELVQFESRGIRAPYGTKVSTFSNPKINITGLTGDILDSYFF